MDSKKSNLGSVSSASYGITDSAGKSTNDQEVHWGSEKKDSNPLRGDSYTIIYESVDIYTMSDKSKTDKDSIFSTTDAKDDSIFF